VPYFSELTTGEILINFFPASPLNQLLHYMTVADSAQKWGAGFLFVHRAAKFIRMN